METVIEIAVEIDPAHVAIRCEPDECRRYLPVCKKRCVVRDRCDRYAEALCKLGITDEDL